MKYVLLFFLSIPVQLLIAQPNKGFYWGASIDASMLYENNDGNKKWEILPPPNLYLHFGNVFNQYIRLDASVGYLAFSDNWNGFELGLTLKPLVYDQIYAVAGINYNSISGGGGLGNLAPSYYKKDFTYGNIGLGYFLTKIAFVEFNYEVPFNNSSYGGDFNNPSDGSFKLISKLKLDFGLNFSF